MSAFQQNREFAIGLLDKARKTQLSEVEILKLDKLRNDRNNHNIFYTVQNRTIAIESVSSEDIVIHDLKKGKSYQSRWYQEDIGMPAMTIHNGAIFKTSLIH